MKMNPLVPSLVRFMNLDVAELESNEKEIKRRVHEFDMPWASQSGQPLCSHLSRGDFSYCVT